MSTAFGPYELVHRLGEGGMGEVWCAKKRGSGGFERMVCIKRIRDDQRGDARSAERFFLEARLLGRLHHANIGQIYDAGRVGDEYFIEMEYLHGKDLRSVMKAQLALGPPPPGLGVTIAIEIGRALEYAHRSIAEDGRRTPIIHRDVTPGNVMLCFDGAVKLVDFGLGKAIGDFNPKLTKTGVFVGTIGYIAPELQKGAPASPASDQFSLGIILYESLSGRRLLDRSVAYERPPSECNAGIPQALDAVCLRALADAPAARFASCEDFVAAVDEAAPKCALDARAIAALLGERFGIEARPRAGGANAAATIVEGAAPVVARRSAGVTRPASPDARRRGSPAKRRRGMATRTAWALALGLPAAALAIALSVRWWDSREPATPVGAPTTQTIPSVHTPPPAEQAIDEVPTTHPSSRGELRDPFARPSAKLKSGKAAKRKRRESDDDDMHFMQPSF